MELEGGHRDRQQRASRLLVDNKLTVEIDYSEMHSTLRYAEAGVLVCNRVEAPEHSSLGVTRVDGATRPCSAIISPSSDISTGLGYTCLQSAHESDLIEF